MRMSISEAIKNKPEKSIIIEGRVLDCSDLSYQSPKKSYLITAESDEELEFEFWWDVPLDVNTRFKVSGHFHIKYYNRLMFFKMKAKLLTITKITTEDDIPFRATQVKQLQKQPTYYDTDFILSQMIKSVYHPKARYADYLLEKHEYILDSEPNQDKLIKLIVIIGNQIQESMTLKECSILLQDQIPHLGGYKFKLTAAAIFDVLDDLGRHQYQDIQKQVIFLKKFDLL